MIRQASWLALALLFPYAIISTDETHPNETASESTMAQASSEPASRNRLDFGVEWFDALEGASLAGFLNYSWVATRSHGLAATLSLIGADFGETEGSGIGDLRLQYSYVPSAKLTADSWVPNTLGMGFGLIVPTGDLTKGTGDDRWVAIPTLGWVFLIGERFSILPSFQYFHSFGEGTAATDFKSANLDLGFLYVMKSLVWFNYTPSFFRDIEPRGDTNIDHTLTVGKQFKKTLGLSLQLGTVERGDVIAEASQGGLIGARRLSCTSSSRGDPRPTGRCSLGERPAARLRMPADSTRAARVASEGWPDPVSSREPAPPAWSAEWVPSETAETVDPYTYPYYKPAHSPQDQPVRCAANR